VREGGSYRIPRRFLVIVFFLSVGLGIFYLRSIREAPQYRVLVLDEWSYDSKAMGLLDGTWPDRRVYYQDPLYSYFLAFIYRIIGHRIVAVKYLQVFLGGLHVLLIYGVARRVFGKGAAVVAALMAALYKPLFFFEGILTKEILSLALMDGSLFFLLRARESSKVYQYVMSGIFLGLACLTRANVILLVPFWAFWCLFSIRREAGLKRGLIISGAFVAGCVAAIAPVTIHNLRSGDFVLLTSQGGQNFYIGNHPENQSGTYIPPPFLRAHPKFEEDDFRAETNRRIHEAMKPSQISQFWYGKSMDYAKAQPRLFWRNMALKTALFFNDFELSDNANYYFYKQKFSWVLRLPMFTYGVASIFGLFGWLALVARKGRGGGLVQDGGWPLIFFLPLYAASTIAYYIFDRYRAPALSALIPLSAFGLKVLWEALIEGRRKTFFFGLLLVVALGIGVYWPLKKPMFDVAYYQLGNGYRELARFDDAEKAYRKAIFLNPGVLAYRMNLGLSLDLEGRHEDAAKEFKIAVGLFPADAALREALGNAFVEMGRTRDAIVQYELAINYGGDSPRLLYNLGLAYKKMGLQNNAQLYFRLALEKDPQFKPALEELH